MSDLQTPQRDMRERHWQELDTEERLVVGMVVLEYERCALRCGETVVRLTPKERDLLRVLMARPGRVYSRELLLRVIWGTSHPGYYRAVDAHVNRLKIKLRQHGAAESWLEGVYGAGYRVIADETAAA